MSKRLYAIAAILLGLSLQGCSSQVAMLDPRIPDPLITKLPMKVAVRYPPEFDEFVHEERVIGKEVWKIDLGESNKLLFDKLLSSMFSNVLTVPAEADVADYEFDALIEPSIDAFEFSVPQQSQTEAFAVWIRYRLRIFDHHGTQIANWPIAAYGKSQATKFGSDQALRYAAVLAMRDAAALIILQMDKATGISKLRRSQGIAPAESAKDVAPAAAQSLATEEILNEGS